jgi:ABC-type multidrug transport system fused ATPase/permease subunit
VAFFHFAVIRGEALTPSIAFTSLAVFNEMRFALNALPETFINMLQSLVSVRRIEKYLAAPEVESVTTLKERESSGWEEETIEMRNSTVTWPRQAGKAATSEGGSVPPSPKHRFVLVDMNLSFPQGELSLICGKLGQSIS